MSLPRYALFFLVGLALIVLGPPAFTQQGGWGGLGTGRPGGGPGAFEPEALFRQMSGGADVLDVQRVRVPPVMARWMTEDQLRERMLVYLQRKGVASGRMTLEQYTDFNAEQRRLVRMRAEAERRGEVVGEAARPGAVPGEKDALPRTDAPGAANVRVGPPMPGAPGPPSLAPSARPAGVYKPSRLPVRDLPEWFVSLDKDADGQVGLYEWLDDRRGVAEFESMDANGDGLVTVEEYLRFQKGRERGGR